MYKVLVADDMPQIRDYFTTLIQNESDMEVVGVAHSGAEAVEKAEELMPDVILMDIQMENDTAGIDATKIIKDNNPEVKVIMLTIHDDNENILESYMAGASDFIMKTASFVEVLTSLREVVDKSKSRVIINQKIVDEMVRLRTEQKSLLYVVNIINRLTRSEIEVLKMVYDGYSYRDIAIARYVEGGTIRSLVNKILKKTNSKKMKDLISNLKQLKILELYDFLK